MRTELEPSQECIPVDRFGSALTEAEQTHVDTCARCEAELTLWKAFTDSQPAADEGAAVQWIVSELQRRSAPRRPPVPAAAWLSGLRLRSAIGLAAAAMLSIVGYLALDREPRLVAPAPGEAIYRSAGVEVVSPLGDVARAPDELAWQAVDGAVRYDVQVLEVDRTIVWRTASLSSRVPLPGSVIQLIVPGKTILWEVTAIDASGVAIASSGSQRFRVPIATTPGR